MNRIIVEHRPSVPGCVVDLSSLMSPAAVGFNSGYLPG